MENIFVYNLKFGEDGRDEERGCQRFGFKIIYEVVEFVLRSLLLAYQQVFCHSKDMILGNSWVQMEKEEYLGKSWLGRKNEIQNDTSSTTDIWSCCSIHYC
ncbi:hypothetical protein CUMW_217970 [Citrus unshiu]|uniref:Uncharacterized protein n=1 Tax=Citrus unshiu TaxID=55188 RepID=A0A2H5QD03_CITUN|nr:hypothetical protein CUMW_217970 [Citrus unshiu]